MRKYTLLANIFLCAVMLLSLSACRRYEMPEVKFFFKTTDGKGPYSEDIEAFEVNKVFYTNIGIRLATNKKRPYDYLVVVEVPKTQVIQISFSGGIWAIPSSGPWDGKITRYTFRVQGYKDTEIKRLSFSGKPTEEGEGIMTVRIYREDGTPVKDGLYYKKLNFKYDLQE